VSLQSDTTGIGRRVDDGKKKIIKYAFPSKMNIATAPESVEIKGSCLLQFSAPKSHLRPETQHKPAKIIEL
jgi:hypothetical protein